MDIKKANAKAAAMTAAKKKFIQADKKLESLVVAMGNTPAAKLDEARKKCDAAAAAAEAANHLFQKALAEYRKVINGPS